VAGKPPDECGRRRQGISTDGIVTASAEAAQVHCVEKLLDQAEIGWLVHNTIVR
jgi:hypothetical protein